MYCNKCDLEMEQVWYRLALSNRLPFHMNTDQSSLRNNVAFYPQKWTVHKISPKYSPMYVVTPTHNTNSDMIFMSHDQASRHLVKKNFNPLNSIMWYGIWYIYDSLKSLQTVIMKHASCIVPRQRQLMVWNLNSIYHSEIWFLRTSSAGYQISC